MGGFKSAVNSKIDDFIDENNLDIPKYNRNNHFFQSNYHDHIIRNNAEYQRIKKYIINNPKKWEEDKLNPGKNKDNSDDDELPF
jgi:putative transposase